MDWRMWILLSPTPPLSFTVTVWRAKSTQRDMIHLPIQQMVISQGQQCGILDSFPWIPIEKELIQCSPTWRALRTCACLRLRLCPLLVHINLTGSSWDQLRAIHPFPKISSLFVDPLQECMCHHEWWRERKKTLLNVF